MEKSDFKHIDGGIRQMLYIALPIVVSTACDTVMVFTDRLFLSRLGPELMNASMGGGLTAMMLSSFFSGLIGYVTAICAQYFGAGRKSECTLTVTQAVIISFMAYPVILLLRPLAYMLFDIMGISPTQLAPQKVYFNILLFGTVISLLRMSLVGFFSGIGKTGIIMISSVVAMLSNVVLNYIFIYGKLGCPALGISGAAYGTIAANMVGLLILFGSYFGKKNTTVFPVVSSLRFDKVIFKKLLRFGSPAGLEMFSNILSFNILVLLFHSHSIDTATAATVMFNWDLVSFVPLIGVEIGVTSLVGRFMGAQRVDVAHNAAMAGLKMGLVYSLCVAVLFIFFPANLVGIFCDPHSVPGVLAVFMVRLAAMYVLIQSVLLVFIGALRGAGDTIWAMNASMFMHWSTAGILALILKLFHASPRIGWAALVLSFCLFSIVVFCRYRAGKWKTIRLIGEPVMPMVGDEFHEVV